MMYRLLFTFAYFIVAVGRCEDGAEKQEAQGFKGGYFAEFPTEEAAFILLNKMLASKVVRHVAIKRDLISSAQTTVVEYIDLESRAIKRFAKSDSISLDSPWPAVGELNEYNSDRSTFLRPSGEAYVIHKDEGLWQPLLAAPSLRRFQVGKLLAWLQPSTNPTLRRLLSVKQASLQASVNGNSVLSAIGIYSEMEKLRSPKGSIVVGVRENGKDVTYEITTFPGDALIQRVVKKENGNLISEESCEVGVNEDLELLASEIAKPDKNSLLNKVKSKGPEMLLFGIEVERENNGQRITRVLSEFPAAEAGLEVGDVIKSLNGSNVSEKTAGQFIAMLRGVDKAELEIIAKTGVKKVTLTGKRSSNSPPVQFDKFESLFKK